MPIRRDPDAVAEARARHPATGWRPDRERVARWLAGRLASDGGPFPAVGARLVAARARTGLTRERFAAVAGISPGELDRCEAGAVAPADLPGELRRLAG